MSQTLSDARELVRLRLEDTGATTGWSDDEVDAGLSRALDEYSHRFPKEQRAEIEVSQGDSSVDLPDGARQVVRVLDSSGHVVPPQAIPPRGTSDHEQAWEVWGERIEFVRALPEGVVTIRFLGPRTFPEASEEPMPVPDEDVSLLATGAAVWCLEQRSVAEWKRGALPARYEMVLRRAREEYQAALRSRTRWVQVARVSGTG